MIDVLVRNRWLLALCGVLEAVCAAINLLMKDADGAVTLRTYAVRATAVLLGKFALGAGVCASAAAVWSFGKGKWWLLALHGIALSLFGLIGVFWSRERLSFLPVALLLVVMGRASAFSNSMPHEACGSVPPIDGYL